MRFFSIQTILSPELAQHEMHYTDFALSSQTTGNLFSYGIQPVSPHLIKLQAVWSWSKKIIHKYILKKSIFYIFINSKYFPRYE